MTEPRRRPRTWTVDPLDNPGVTREQARKAALAVVAHYPEDPWVARHLLEVLGLIDVTDRPG